MAYNSQNGMTPDQIAAKAQQEFAQTQENNAAQIASLATIKEDKDGKKFFLGVEVPPEMVGTLQYAAQVFPTYINDFVRGGAYDHASSFAGKLNKSFGLSADPKFGHKAGLATAATISAALVGLQPISEVVVGVRERSKKRAEIRAALSAVADSTPGSYEHNEVIKTAMERTNDILSAGLKQAAGEIPTVALNGYYALGSHRELAKEKTVQFDKKQIVDANAKGMSSSANDVVRRIAQDKKADADLRKKLGDVKKDGKNVYSEAEIDRYVRAEAKKREDIRKLETEAKYKDPETKKEDDDKHKMMPILGVGIVSSLFKHQLAKGDKRDADKTTAYELIIDLQEKINSGHISSNSNITDQIVDIFQQNEIDRGRSGIGPVLQEKLEPLAKRIGEVIAKKELDPLALVNLVGEGKVMNKRRFVDEARLEELLDEQRKLFGGHEKTPLDEFLADFQSPKLIMAAIKENIKTLEGKDKAIFAAMFSDDVLTSAGIDKKDIPALRTAGHDAMGVFVKARTTELAQKTDEQLKAEGLSDKQIQAIKDLNEMIVQGNDKEVKSALDGGDSGVVGAVRNVLLEEQIKKSHGKGGKQFWTEIIAKKAPVVVEKPADSSMAEKVKSGKENGAEIGGIA